jgi:hypothetical protein
VATLYYTWKELVAAKKEVNKNSLLSGFYEFHEEKKKYPPEEILSGYNFMIHHSIHPTEQTLLPI